MSDWRISLDRYLTTPPDDPYDNWCEEVIDQLSEDFYETNEDWILYSDLCDDWLFKLYKKRTNPEKAALIIQRAFKSYKIKS